MYLPEPTVVDGICVCSGLADCDHHACCGGCPDNTDFGCGECWSRDCYEHNFKDLEPFLSGIEKLPAEEQKPYLPLLERWRQARQTRQDQNAS